MDYVNDEQRGGDDNSPIYFNITEEKPISWLLYLNLCKRHFDNIFVESNYKHARTSERVASVGKFNARLIQRFVFN